MKQHFFEKEICYDGTQLRSHWIFDQTGFVGDAIAAFVGPADVSTKHMVDLVDVRNNAPIASRSMLHVVVEHFGCDLEKGILRQRLLIVAVHEELLTHAVCANVIRRGNDLYDGEQKLSVSIAALSPVSCCIHFGINIVSAGTPVPTKGLTDYEISPHPFATRLLTRYTEELRTIEIARCKVRPIV